MRAILSLAAVLVASALPAESATLRVSPITLELRVPRSATTLSLRNDADRPLDVQVRVFRWSQEGGVDRYEPTTAVVASPPATRLAPRSDYTVRVVRVSKAPIRTEESYRVIIDELPTALVRRPGTVNFVMRHSIPVFFRNPQAAPPKVSWSLDATGGKLTLVARNDGGSRLKLSDLSILQGDRPLGQKRGLVGYVLAGATMQWPLPGGRRLSGGMATIKGETHLGVIHEPLPVIGR